MDDPYIFARYAAHLWRYGDLLWNPGEPRIEGFSSWLWLGVYAVGVKIMPDPVVFARIIGLACGSVLVAVFAHDALRDATTRAAGWPASIFLAACPALAYYAGCGMDQILWALVVWLFVRWVGRAQRIAPRHGIVAAAGLFVRPEGFLLFVPLCSLLLGDALFAKDWRRSVGAWRVLVPGLASMAGLFVGRRMLFDAWLPNAAAAKHAGGDIGVRLLEGATYLGPGVAFYLAVPAVAGILNLATGRVREVGGDGPGRIGLAGIGFSVVLVGFVWIAGGDDVPAFGESRLLLPALAPAAWVLYLALRQVGPVRCLLVLLVVLAVRLPSGWSLLKEATQATDPLRPADVLVGWTKSLKPYPLAPMSRYLLEKTPPGEFIAVPWAGLIPWQTDLPTIDLLGLNDRHIAKAPYRGRVREMRYDADYVLRRRPYLICETFVVRGNVEELARRDDETLRRAGAFKTGHRELIRHPLLAAHYRVDERAPVGTCFRRVD